MTMSILDLLQHIVNEPAPRLGEPWGDGTVEAAFVDACLRKDADERPSPPELLVGCCPIVTCLCALLIVFSSLSKRPGCPKFGQKMSTSRRGRKLFERSPHRHAIPPPPFFPLSLPCSHPVFFSLSLRTQCIRPSL